MSKVRQNTNKILEKWKSKVLQHIPGVLKIKNALCDVKNVKNILCDVENVKNAVCGCGIVFI